MSSPVELEQDPQNLNGELRDLTTAALRLRGETD